nr:MAG TPA: hypothetical protein [Caudoviricetes sp.]
MKEQKLKNTQIPEGYEARIYNSGNYFRTKEQAEHAASAIRELLKNYHVNNE